MGLRWRPFCIAGVRVHQLLHTHTLTHTHTHTRRTDSFALGAGHPLPPSSSLLLVSLSLTQICGRRRTVSSFNTHAASSSADATFIFSWSCSSFFLWIFFFLGRAYIFRFSFPLGRRSRCCASLRRHNSLVLFRGALRHPHRLKVGSSVSAEQRTAGISASALPFLRFRRHSFAVGTSC